MSKRSGPMAWDRLERKDVVATLAAAFRAAADRHDEATKPNAAQSPAPPTKEEYAVHMALAADYRAIADEIERHAAKETEA